MNWLRTRLHFYRSDIWRRFVRKIGQHPALHEELRHRFGLRTAEEQRLDRQDDRAVLTAVVLVLEVLERSKTPGVAERATRHLEAVLRARQHRHGDDHIRELPPLKGPTNG